VSKLNTNEVRARAGKFAEEWKDARYEKGETQSFYNDFFDVFGVKRRQVAIYEEPVKRLGEKRGFLDLFWKSVLLVEQKSAGGNLVRAKSQALDYFPGLKAGDEPRYVLVSDFQTFELYDLHRSFNGCAASGINSFDDCSDANRTVRYLLELHVRIPARMVANVLMSEEAEYIRNRAIDYLG